MFGIGGAELLILIAIALILFGAPVLTFLFGYALGKKRAGTSPADADTPAIPAPPEERSDR